MTNKLTLKQRQFANEYIANRGNATKAVLKAYDTDNYASAQAIGSQNLSKVNIASYIDELLADSDGLTLDDALNGLAQCLHAPMKPTVSAGEKLAAITLLLKLHKAIPEKQSTSAPTFPTTVSQSAAKSIIAKVLAQGEDITPETPQLDPESD